MSENLREHIMDPTLHQDIVENAHLQGRPVPEAALDEKLAQPIEKNLVTWHSPSHAYEVAHAIKPETDKISSLQERIDNPMTHAAVVVENGQPTNKYIGVEDTRALKNAQKAAKVDLERNARLATRLSVKRGLGHRAVVNS